MKTTIEIIKSKNPLIAKIHGEIGYFIRRRANDALKREIENILKENKRPELTHEEQIRFIDAIEVQMCRDYFIAVGKYLISGDEITVKNYGTQAGTIEINLDVIRDGKKYYFNTELILAGGYNIQCLHYRYISKTDINKNEKNEIEDLTKKVTKIEKEIENLKYFLNVQVRYEIDLINAEVSGKTNDIKRFKNYIKEIQKNIIKSRSKIESLK